MRTRTNFVVEYKTNRRLAKAQPSSIWGNLDLKAVARQVDADNGQPEEVPAKVFPRPEERSETVSPAALSEIQAEVGEGESSSPVVLLQAASEQEATEKREPADEALAKHRATRDPAKESQPKTKLTRGGWERHRKRRLAAVAQSQEASADDLDALEVENRQLRRLMIARLLEENKLLKTMLARFVKI